MLYDNIMVPYDGSPSARAALEEAARFANEDPGLTLRIVTIIDAESRVAAYLEKHPLPESVVPSARLRGRFFSFLALFLYSIILFIKS